MRTIVSTVVAFALAFALSACSSLNNAGTAEYSIKPFIADKESGRVLCCEVTVRNGKEIANLEAHIEKKGDDYQISLKEQGVEAFRGQAIAANTSKAAVAAAARAAEVIIAPAAILAP